MIRAAFIDRDGVINRKPPEDQYVTHWEDMHFLQDAIGAIALLNQAGFRVIVVTNQRCIAMGLISAVALESMHQRLCTELATNGATIDAIYYCPHEKNPPCSCRKPAPGMLLAAAHDHAVDLRLSWMIGDSEADIEAGRNAGCRTARILKGHQTAILNSDVIGASLLDVVNKLLNWEQTIAVSHSKALSGRIPAALDTGSPLPHFPRS